MKPHHDGYYFRSFTLPETDERNDEPLENSSASASWYFLNRLDFIACIEGVFPHENFQCETHFRQREKPGVKYLGPFPRRTKS
jgi:hypothetical protein